MEKQPRRSPSVRFLDFFLGEFDNFEVDKAMKKETLYALIK